MKVENVSHYKIPVKYWLKKSEDIEDGCWKQIDNLARLPFAFNHIAIMPDTHQGYGMPIGGVMATKDVIIPNAVGVDIGCGMCAVETSLTKIDIDTLKKIMGEIRKAIPVGFNKHKEKQDEKLMPEIKDYLWKINRMTRMEIVGQQYQKALYQLGTLGGGNHFIEIQKGNDGHVWIMIHSGSRNLGFTVANHYNKLAIEINEKYYSQIPKEWELAFLPLDSQEGQEYIQEMNYCVEFALVNRKLMMDKIIQIIFKETNMEVSPMINIAHNYAVLENHFGSNVWVHRKGATRAYSNEIGIIPGSQGTKSYIVKGKGNEDSFKSCSHGAGRLMGRNVAKKTLNLETEQKMLNDQGIIHSIRNIKDLDEAPSAYKNIDTVMKNQKDLVDILVELKPLAVIKG